jgi:hypothetical protein
MLMSLLHGTTRGATHETGAVLVMFTVFASVVILMLAFVLDAGNWFLHQRHLQVQADAAALAAAQDFAFPCTAAVKKSIYETAGQYGGAASVVTPAGSTVTSRTPLFNEQIGGALQSNIHEVINKKKYFEQASEDTTVVEKPPCEEEGGKEEGANMIDVKLTETNLPWFFKALNVPDINAHARVSIVSQTKATAVLPAIESEPVEGRVYFVNDETDENNREQDKLEGSEVIASAPLTKGEATSVAGEGRVKWSNTIPAAVNIGTHAHIGVRIAFAGKPGLFKEGEKTTAACWQRYVECVTTDNRVVPPLIHIAGYTEEGTATSPEKSLARQVTLSKGASDTCTDGYFSDYLAGPTCTFTITAKVDYGSTSIVGMTVTPEVVAEENRPVAGQAAMECKATGKGTVMLCTGQAKAPGLGSSDTNGSSQINLVLRCKREAKAPCEKSSKSEEKHTLSDVQRIFSTGPDGSQRIVAAQISEPEATETPVPKERGANSYEVCDPKPKNNCTHKLVVTVEVVGSLRNAQTFSEGAFHIQYGDQDADIDDQFVISCPPSVTEAGAATAWRTNLEKGCKGNYKLNTTDPECKKPRAEEPYGCVGIVNVPRTSVEGLNTLFKEGMSVRIEKPPTGRYYCHNNWTNNNGGKVPIIPPNDSRLIQLFVVPYSVANSLSGSKALAEVPIEHFATFYVTGWPGDKCKLTSEEEKQYPPDDPAGPREIVGHLIKYVNVLTEGSEGARCSTSPESIDTCVVALTQ